MTSAEKERILAYALALYESTAEFKDENYDDLVTVVLKVPELTDEPGLSPLICTSCEEMGGVQYVVCHAKEHANHEFLCGKCSTTKGRHEP